MSNSNTNETYSLDYNGKLNISENDLIIEADGSNAKSIKNMLDDLKENLLKTIYPVGSIYTSFNNTNPNSILGFGTWERINNQFLFCLGDEGFNDPLTGNIVSNSGITSGESTHKLIEDELAQHSHSMNSAGNHTHKTAVSMSSSSSSTAWCCDDGEDRWGWSSLPTSEAGSHTHTINSTGKSNPHNNMPPYITCYAWRRTQ